MNYRSYVISQRHSCMKSRYLNLAVWTWSLHSNNSEWNVQCDIIYVLKKPLPNMTSVSRYAWCMYANTEENVLDLSVYKIEWWLPLERVERKVKIEMAFKWALDLSVRTSLAFQCTDFTFQCRWQIRSISSRIDNCLSWQVRSCCSLNFCR